MKRAKRDDGTLDLLDWSPPDRAVPLNGTGERFPCTCDLGHARVCDACRRGHPDVKVMRDLPYDRVHVVSVLQRAD